LSVRKMSEQMTLSYNTVYNAVQTIRSSILAHAEDAHNLFNGEIDVKTFRRGGIIYTDKFKSYDSLMFCGYRRLKIDRGKLSSSGKFYINGPRGVLELGQGKTYKTTWRFQNTFPSLFKRT